MIRQLRKVVAGPKKCTEWDDIKLDFTYITDFVAAMAFPASGLETTYRNSIKDVSKFLQQKHKNSYLIINVSNRQYDTEPFNNMVLNYTWEDHQAPTLDVLFQVCFDAYTFLSKKNKNHPVVCFHCNHGKGRTGTAIICFILFTGFFTNDEETLKFYNKKRFSGQGYGVSQPCQLRYIGYFSQVIKKFKSKELIKNIIGLSWHSLKMKGLDESYYITISSTRNGHNKHVKVNVTQTQINSKIPLFCDIYIEIRKKNWSGDKVVARANVNLIFLQPKDNGNYLLILPGNQIRTSKSHHTDFTLQFVFRQFCSCHQKQVDNCICEDERKVEQHAWDKMHKLAEVGTKISIKQACRILFDTYVCSQESKLIPQ